MNIQKLGTDLRETLSLTRNCQVLDVYYSGEENKTAEEKNPILALAWLGIDHQDKTAWADCKRHVLEVLDPAEGGTIETCFASLVNSPLMNETFWSQDMHVLFRASLEKSLEANSRWRHADLGPNPRAAMVELSTMVADCRHPDLLNDKSERVKYFVYYRRNMPSFLNIKHWYELVKGNSDPSRLLENTHFPWTPEFTKSNTSRIDELQRMVEDKGPKGAKLPVDPTVKGWPTVVAYCEGLKRDDQVKALAEAGAKVTCLTDAQKALAAMMSHTEEPECSWSAAKEGSGDTDMAGNTPVEPAPEDHRGVTSVPEAEEASAEAALFALAKEEKEKANRQSWSEEVEDEDEGVDSDDDLDVDDLVRKRNKQRKAALIRMAILAKSQATKE